MEQANKKKNPALTPSLRKILQVMLLTLIPILVASSVFIIHSIWSTQNNNIKRLTSAMETQIDEASDSLIRMNYFLIDSLLNNVQIKTMTTSVRTIEKNTAARTLWNELNFESKFWAVDFSFYVYSTKAELSVSKFNSAIPYEHNSVIRSHIRDIADSGEVLVNDLNWVNIVVGDNVYLYQLYYDNGNYLSSWVSCDTLFAGIRTSSLSESGQILYLDSENNPLTGLSEFTRKKIRVEDGRVVSAKWGGIGEIFHMSRTDIRVLIQDNPYVDRGSFFYLLSFISIVLLVILAVSFYTLRYFRKYIEEPFLNLQHHVNEYALSREAARKKGFSELNKAVEAFDSLSEQLNELKIDVYEEKLAIAQTELEYYQIQIKPHFFVNCFTIIHAMAQKKDYPRIQEFCIKLSNYVRFLLTDSMTMIPLKEELSVMREYLDIQKIRYKTSTVLRGDIDDSLYTAKIPPLILLTFVENSVKHGAKENEKITIEVKIHEVYLYNEKKMHIIITDNGIGFPSEVLDLYNALGNNEELEDFSHDRHLGIRNIYTRLYLLYGDNFTLRFSNRKDGGGKVEIIIPMKKP